MHCKNCKHWDESYAEWDTSPLGMCRGIEEAWEVTRKAREAKGLDQWDDWDAVEAAEKAALLEAKAVAQDGSSYAASVRTAPDFGCLKFTPK